MPLINLIHIADYDRTRGRFRSEAFEPSSAEHGGGISVFDAECAMVRSGSICAHARKYYPTVANEPPIFWQFDFSILPAGVTIDKTPSNTGDECHRDLKNVGKKPARRVFIEQPLTDFLICTKEGIRNLTQEDVVRLKDQWDKKIAGLQGR